ncbi:diphthine--ammonia ligase [Fictibacillus sp. KIGAM418]|uniref:Diphthine--ammonia ligase n=1 Tax=Fictibacillus marinisediminis TaxID=2878389 RepID=A0A9X1X8D9_9BACL|nr:diphthine--ammonia ligase [Fictibacillus marinisediminis]MCK6256012.1 diphthine--ammonia ligase [Fictibacillus marinisediminis]
MTKKIVVSFSGGKDSMLALHKLLESKEYEIDSLLTTVNEDFKRTSIHGIREEILDAQANALGFPVRKVRIPKVCTNEIYEERMREEMDKVSQAGIQHVMFGDIFLADIREYRESKLKPAGMEAVFPLWGAKSEDLIDEFLALGYRTVVTTLDRTKLNEDFLGREINGDWRRDLPENVDACGENGEFHTLVIGGPLFRQKIEVVQGSETVRDGNFVYRDFMLAE